ncbi:hypothetical protein [Domibacillus epiphyticus]|uniref:Uncharacterized protein n=1 Tax=Domibacillus epiphyticus TaxID=1714355 RepID=A0A1V2A7E9_9BACI|nr:hypothetical protein [Domibacillus epiphyticus]OMP66886.1 hypothetical protein BTO28_09745 [Domibacillus epiphyticus]
MIEIAGVFSVKVEVDYHDYEQTVHSALQPHIESGLVVKILKISRPSLGFNNELTSIADCIYKLTLEEVEHFTADSDYLGIVSDTLRSRISWRVFSPTVYTSNKIEKEEEKIKHISNYYEAIIDEYDND